MKAASTEGLLAQARALGPYLAVELIVPGGSPLLLWLYRNRLAVRRTESVR